VVEPCEGAWQEAEGGGYEITAAVEPLSWLQH
jgi:hypothetical protein